MDIIIKNGKTKTISGVKTICGECNTEFATDIFDTENIPGYTIYLTKCPICGINNRKYVHNKG